MNVSVIYKDKLKHRILDNVNSYSGIAETLEPYHLCGPLSLVWHFTRFHYHMGPLTYMNPPTIKMPSLSTLLGSTKTSAHKVLHCHMNLAYGC